MWTRVELFGTLPRSAKSFVRLRCIIPASAPPVGPVPFIVYDLPAGLRVTIDDVQKRLEGTPLVVYELHIYMLVWGGCEGVKKSFERHYEVG